MSKNCQKNRAWNPSLIKQARDINTNLMYSLKHYPAWTTYWCLTPMTRMNVIWYWGLVIADNGRCREWVWKAGDILRNSEETTWTFQWHSYGMVLLIINLYVLVATLRNNRDFEFVTGHSGNIRNIYNHYCFRATLFGTWSIIE